MSLRAATVRGLVRSPSAGVFSGADDQWNPRMLPNLAAWFDALDVSTMLSGDGSTITDGGAVALWGDKSGNSGTNVLVHNVSGVGNSATIPSIGAFGTSDFTVTAWVFFQAVLNGTDQLILQNAPVANGFSFGIKNGTDRLATSKSVVGYTSATSTVGLSNLTWYHVGYTRSGTTGTYYVNGAAAGTCTDSYDYAATGVLSMLTGGASAVGAMMRLARVYSVALDAAGVLADYNGTVQANNVVNCDFSQSAKKLANGDTFVCATGQTVTLNSSGATGARIAGERDLFQGTLANRPVYLNYAGTKYGYLNGTAGNYFSTPDDNKLDITGDIDLRAYVAMADWTPSAAQTIVCKWGASGGTAQSYLLELTTAGYLRFVWTTSGTYSASLDKNSGAATGFADLSSGWVRATLDVDNGASKFEVKFWTSTDGETWTQLGGTVTGASTTSIYSSSTEVRVGQSSDSGFLLPASGRIYRAQIYDGIGGTLKSDFNPALYTSGTTFTASTGEVWTINGGAHIVTRTGLYFDGSNDYLKTAAFSLSQPETLYFVGSQVSFTSGDRFLDGNAAVSGLMYQAAGPTYKLNAGSDFAGPSMALAACTIVTGVINGASSAIRTGRNAASTGNSGAANMGGVTIGADGGGTSHTNIFVSEVPIYSAAHATSTQDRMALYAGRRHGFAV